MLSSHGIWHGQSASTTLQTLMNMVKPNLRVIFAAHIRNQRVALGLTQQEVARRLKMDRSYMAKIERAEVNFSLKTMDKLRSELLVTVPEPKAYQKTLAERVFRLRSSMYSQGGLSEKAGLSIAFIGRLERGESNTSIDQIESLSRALYIDGQELLSD